MAGHRLRRPCLALYFRVMSTPSFDTGTPNVARMYDYWLGGTDNFEADRQAAAAVRKIRPNVAEQALANKRFQTRAVTYVAGHGVRQFLDVGSGLPTSPAQAPGPRRSGWPPTRRPAGSCPTPWWRTWTTTRSRCSTPGCCSEMAHDAVVAVEADMRDPKAILADDEIRAAGLRPGRARVRRAGLRAALRRRRDRPWHREHVRPHARARVLPGDLGRVRPGPGGNELRQHVQRPERAPDLRPFVGGDHRSFRRPGPGAAGHRGNLGLAARPAGNRAGRPRVHDRRRRRPPPVKSQSRPATG